LNLFNNLKENILFESVACEYHITFNNSKKGLCPFHDDQNPSLHNYGTHGYCFVCGKSIDIVDLEAHFKNLSPFDATKSLADRYKIKLPNLNIKDKEFHNKKNQAQELVEWLCIYGNKKIKKHPEVIHFLKNKGFNEFDIDNYRIGYVGKENPVTKILKLDSEIELAKLIGLNNENGDHFKNRVIFPILNRYGKPIFLTGRAYPSGEPKYLHLKNSDFFVKEIAFAENLNKEKCVIVESVTDAIAFKKNNIPSIALLGTNPGEKACERLKKSKSKLYFCFDPDSAGELASYKLSKKFRGYILDLVSNKDPDELLAEMGDYEFKKRVKEQIEKATYYLDEMINRVGVSESYEDILSEFINIKLDGDREPFVKKLAEKKEIKVDIIWNDIKKIQRNITVPETNPHTYQKDNKTETKFTIYTPKIRGRLENIKQSEGVKGKNHCFTDIIEEASKFLFITPDTEYVFKITLSSVLANYSIEDPVWLQIIAPPSSAKTEIILAHSAIPTAWNISSLTSKTLVSGDRTNDKASLLTRIGEFGFIFLKDFTTILQLNYHERAEIFAQLREVYDGHYSKTFGTGKTVSWHGKIGIISACTPIIEKYTKNLSTLGERFLFTRIDDFTRDNEDKALDIALSSAPSKISISREKLQEKVSEFVRASLSKAIDFELELSRENIASLKKYSRFIAKVRSDVARDSYERDAILAKPFSESPMRVSKQLKSILKGLCVVDNCISPNEGHFGDLAKLALDNLPPLKREIIDHIPPEGIHRVDLARSLGYGENNGYFKRLIEDLSRLEIVKTEKPVTKITIYRSDIIKEFYEEINKFQTQEPENTTKSVFVPENRGDTYENNDNWEAEEQSFLNEVENN